jgi:hypothetical protein
MKSITRLLLIGIVKSNSKWILLHLVGKFTEATVEAYNALTLWFVLVYRKGQMMCEMDVCWEPM